MESLPICRHTGASDPHRTHTGTQTPPRRHTQPQTRRTHILTNNLHVLPKNSKSTDPISSLNTHGPTGTNTPTLISQGLSAWLMGEAGPGLAGALTGPYWFISLFCVSCKAATVAVAVAVAVAAAAATAAAAAAAAG